MSALMSWEQKFAAIKAFAGDANLEMREPGDWYVSCGMSVGGDGMLSGQYGNGINPVAAIEDHWSQYSSLAHNRYAVNRKNERARWNGFMWRAISEEEALAMRWEPA